MGTRGASSGAAGDAILQGLHRRFVSTSKWQREQTTAATKPAENVRETIMMTPTRGGRTRPGRAHEASVVTTSAAPPDPGDLRAARHGIAYWAAPPQDPAGETPEGTASRKHDTPGPASAGPGVWDVLGRRRGRADGVLVQVIGKACPKT